VVVVLVEGDELVDSSPDVVHLRKIDNLLCSQFLDRGVVDA
jgi:hypothetical protein